MLRVWSSSGEELACMPLAQVGDVRTLKRHLRSTCGLPACFQKLFRIPSAVRKDLNDDLLSVFKSLGQAIDVQLVAVTCSDDTILSLEILEAVRNSELSAARLLFEAGANTECRDPHGNTPLMLASANGHIQMLCFLLEAGARLNSQDHNQKTALNLAAAHGYAEIVSLLLEAGLDKDWQDVHGTTPLISACIAHHVRVVEVLLAAKASTDKIQQHGSTALMWASAKGHTRIVSLLLEARASTDEGGVDSTALIDAAINDNIDSVYLLLNARELRIRWQDPLADEDSITQQEREQSGSQGRAGAILNFTDFQSCAPRVGHYRLNHPQSDWVNQAGNTNAEPLRRQVSPDGFCEDAVAVALCPASRSAVGAVKSLRPSGLLFREVFVISSRTQFFVGSMTAGFFCCVALTQPPHS
ncbi:ANKRD50 [Symbiodinium necroappetens]|uniref:ANKRD50 protein n=1 Tax=Symbiodinium necroappetens TaxID=1628268 RepID=A0A812YH28_9DINO|nr:ANKRD50 [Symbiodinium necroappetens]